MAEQFAPAGVYGNEPAFQVMVAPPRYIQGQGALQITGRVMKMLGYHKVGVLASRRGLTAQAADVTRSLADQSIAVLHSEFAGECSLQEIERNVASLAAEGVDCLIAVGGGKCVDAGKCIAHRLAVPVVVVPTLASNDAPCSALSVVYSPEGVVVGAEFFPASPIAVIVDTAVIAAADERYLVAGMGDAMATWYEARVCRNNPGGLTVLGARPTMTACAMGELCANTLFQHGVAAAANVRAGNIDAPLEQVVEANTLLSGVGFESGGLAGAHAYAQGYTVIPEVERRHLHGEMVAMGTIAQLVMEKDIDEARRVARFFASVGLPVQLEQLALDAQNHAQLDAIVAGAMTFAPLANFAFEVTPALLKDAMLQASRIGADTTHEQGEEAYQRCMSNA